MLPEDDANRQLAIGFRMDPSVTAARIHVLPVAGGWVEVLNRFQSDHIADMESRAGRYMVLLIDFDTRYDERLTDAKNRIPEHLMDRVFFLGAWSRPEALKGAGLGSYETIGMKLAQDCRDDTDTTWNREQLRHNAGEIARMRETVRPILFPPA